LTVYRKADYKITPRATPTGLIEGLKFWNRYGWRDFYFEYAVLALCLVYYTAHYLGKRRNMKHAYSWVRANEPLLTSQFAQFGIPSVNDGLVPLSHDGGGVFEAYATGRTGVKRLWVEIQLVSRHDVVAWIMEIVGGWLFDYLQGDVVEVSIQPSAEWEGFTWGIVRKAKMRKLRESRYDLVPPPLNFPQVLFCVWKIDVLVIHEGYGIYGTAADVGYFNRNPRDYRYNLSSKQSARQGH